MHQIRFRVRSGFHETVKQRVAQYFADRRQATTGDWRLFVKTGVILTWLAGSYALLVFGSTSLCVTMLAVFALAQACALVSSTSCRMGHTRATPTAKPSTGSWAACSMCSAGASG